MKQYLDLLSEILENGEDRSDRTGVGTRSIFGRQLVFDMKKGFPAITTKKLAFHAMKVELIWLLSGSGDIKFLQENNCHIWDENANADYWKPKAKFEGDLGRVYGVQWRTWNGANGKVVDQITEQIERLKKNPTDRRLIISAWNPAELDEMALPPCHILFQLYSSSKGLSLKMYQRSADMFLGVPFNIASYALLLSMIAQVTGSEPNELIITFGDTHIYNNHFNQAREQLGREVYELPKLWLNPEIKNIFDFKIDDIKLIDYKSHASIKAEMAV